MSVPVRDAATIVVVRDGGDGLEVLLLERNGQSGFVPGAHLFPGGAIDAEDHDPAVTALSVRPAEEAVAVLGRPDALGFYVAALRECFEECGILLTSTPLPIDRLVRHRQALAAGERTFADLCRTEGIALATDAMAWMARWITPEGAPRRYDTQFFVAIADARHEAVPDGVEAVAARWVAPEVALGRFEAGSWPMIEPTVHTLRALVPFATAAEAFAAIAETNANGKPEVVGGAFGHRVRLPADEAAIGATP